MSTSAILPGEKFDVDIRYEGKPSKGLYFILPDKANPSPRKSHRQGRFTGPRSTTSGISKSAALETARLSACVASILV
jgi:hypothetical protein